MPPEYDAYPDALSWSGGAGAPTSDPYPAAPQSALAGEDANFLAYLNADARASTGDNGKPSYTIAQAANQIVRGEPGWSSSLGEPFTVTYAYRASAPASMPSDTAGFQRFSTAQINQAELALKAWSDVANIRFVRVGVGTSGDAAYSNSATILMGNYTSGEDGASAFTYFPGSTAASSLDGDLWINSTFSYNQAPTSGNYGGNVLIHELGHAIGLEHPSDYNASADATLTYDVNASYYEDDRQYTVMSYFGEQNTGGYFAGAYPAAPMLDDIAAAQLEYGPNMSTRTGDTVYGFNSNAGLPWFSASSSTSKLVFAVWDAGGTDTFNFSGYGQNQLIDLRAGFFSNVGGLRGDVAVAANATIENAIGGARADVIHGNSANNSLLGGAGADSLDGGLGGRDTMLGLDGNDSITGGAGFDNVNGNKGADTIVGGAGDDWLLGGQGDDLISATAGNVNLNGNLGFDTVNAGPGADTVHGGQANDLLNGGAGADQMYGDLGDDVLTGGAGADTFHIAPGGGHDRVTDFNLGEGDRVQLDAGVAYSLTQPAGDAVVTLTATGDELILVGVQAASLPPGTIFLA